MAISSNLSVTSPYAPAVARAISVRDSESLARQIPALAVPGVAVTIGASAQAPLPRLSVTLPLRLLTPIIGGGVRPMEPDRAQPVRVTALRGALRWWWRVLQSTPDVRELREHERL